MRLTWEKLQKVLVNSMLILLTHMTDLYGIVVTPSLGGMTMVYPEYIAALDSK